MNKRKEYDLKLLYEFQSYSSSDFGRVDSHMNDENVLLEISVVRVETISCHVVPTIHEGVIG